MTNSQHIIDEFHTIIGDSTELSSDEELKLLNKIYFEVINSREWEILKKEATGSVNGLTIAQPADFGSLVLFPDPVIYLGDTNKRCNVIPFAERRIYKNQNNAAYYDARQKQIVFMTAQDDTYSFDYNYIPAELALDTAPVFPARFWGLFAFFMASDNDFIQLMDKARSYASENRMRGQMILDQMVMWDSKLNNMTSYGA